MTDYEIKYQQDSAACGEVFPEIVAFFENYPAPSAYVLDLGCGQGRDALIIARYGHRVHGIDLSPTGIEQMLVRARAENLSITAEVADVRDYQPQSEYDIVLIDRVIHMLTNLMEKETLLGKVKQATKNGGYVLVVDTPGNIPIIEAAFKKHKNWQLVFKHKGFRFYKNAV